MKNRSCSLFVAVCAVLFIIAIAPVAQAEAVWEVTGWKPQYLPTLQVSKTTDKISIDGELDEPAWQNAVRATNFTEHNPGREVAPVVRTEAMMTYDNENVYFAAICYADPSTVRASLPERERIFNDDNVGFFFDTYGDANMAYVLNVNPYGIQYDAMWTSGMGEDGAFDMIWESNGVITDSGYQVEVAIPFSSLRFPNKSVQEWRVDFYRHHQRESHYSMSWATYDQDEQCWPCRWGTVTGIADVSPGRGIELMPTFVSYQSSGITDETDPGESFNNGDIYGRASLNSKYAISSNMVAEATINPDFSQVEADAAQIDVNSTFALYYNERRPFFQEGVDLFLTNFNMVYTRTINNPKFSTKFSGKFGGTRVAFLSAYDENSPIIVPFEEFSRGVSAGRSVTNMFAVRRNILNDSHVRLVTTDRRFNDGGSGSLASLDGSIRLSKSNQFIWQFIGTHTEELPGEIDSSEGMFANDKYTSAMDGESFYGHGFLAGVRHNSANFWSWIRYYERSPTYRASNGYQPQNSDRRVMADFQYTIPFKTGLLQRLYPSADFGRIWNTDGLRKDEWIRANLGSSWRFAQTWIGTHVLVTSNERFHGTDFRGIWALTGEFNMAPSKWLAYGLHVTRGHQIARNVGYFGNQVTWTLWSDFRPTERILIEPQFNSAVSYSPSEDRRWFRSSVARTRINFQASKRLSVRLVLQYVDSWSLNEVSTDDGSFYQTLYSRRFDIDPLIAFRINPFSIFYIGSTYDYSDVYDYGEWEDRNDNVNHGNFLTKRQFFMKIQYLFQV